MVIHAAAAAHSKYTMSEKHFYNKTTGKLKKASFQSFGAQHEKTKSPSTVYTIDSVDGPTDEQYPTGKLSIHQQKYIESFLQGITQSDSVDIDPTCRGIHWIGFWTSTDNTTMVSVSMLQPHITNAILHLQRVNENVVRGHASRYFPPSDKGEPTISTPKINVQLHGKFSMPLADSMIEHGILSGSNVSWSNMVLSETQPIFIVADPNGIRECKLTHASCSILETTCPPHVGISSPPTRTQSYSFRSRNITGGRGTGPSITIHRSGTLQYQGKPENAYIVGRCFRECIDSVLTSKSAPRFLNSLGVIRTVDDAVHMS
jgi:hypothetical protein